MERDVDSRLSILTFFCSLLRSKAVVALRVSTKKALNVDLNEPQVGGSKDENGHSQFVPLAEEHP